MCLRDGRRGPQGSLNVPGATKNDDDHGYNGYNSDDDDGYNGDDVFQ